MRFKNAERIMSKAADMINIGGHGPRVVIKWVIPVLANIHTSLL
jgi:hypothetical protein